MVNTTGGGRDRSRTLHAAGICRRRGAAICGNQAAALAGRGPDPRRLTRRLNLKDLRPIRGPNLRRSAIKKIAHPEVISTIPAVHKSDRDNIGGNRWIIPPAAVATGREPYMRRVLGDAWRLLWSRIFFGRRSPQMGPADRAQIFFIVGSRFLTRMGTSACFAAAGSARIVGTENTTGMY